MEGLGDDQITIKKVWYTYSVITSFVTNNCHYIFFPVILSKMYGTNGGLLAYSAGFVFVADASLTNTLMLTYLYPSMGFKGISWM